MPFRGVKMLAVYLDSPEGNKYHKGGQRPRQNEEKKLKKAGDLQI
jgi:hypothetical protein